MAAAKTVHLSGSLCKSWKGFGFFRLEHYEGCLTRNYPNSHNCPSRLWSQLKAHCIERGDDQAVILFVPQFDRANHFGQPPGDFVLITRVNSRNRSASMIVDSNAFEIPTNWTVRSVCRLVPLKRYPCWCQAAQPEL